MDRSSLLAATAASATLFALISRASQAQQAGKLYRIGVLVNRGTPSVELDSLRAGLTQLGYVAGTHVVYDVRRAEGQLDLLPGFAAELVAILSDADIPGADASGLAPIDRSNAAAARAAGLTPQVIKARGLKPDLDAAFKAMESEGAQALVVLEVPAVFSIAKTVAQWATTRRLPTMLWGGQGEAGALMSYGTPYTATWARLPAYVDRIFKGAKPANTPIEVFARHQLVINLANARKLGLTVPEQMLKRADRVIG